MRLLDKDVDVCAISERDEKLLEEVIPTMDDCSNDLARLDVEGIVDAYLDEEVDLHDVYATAFVLPEETYLQRLLIKQLETSTEKSPKFSLTALYSDGTEKDVTSEAEWVVTSKNRAVLPEEFITVEDGVVSFAQGSNGNVEISGRYVDPFDTEKKYPRESTKAFLSVEFEEPKDNYIYFYNDPEPLHDDAEKGIWSEKVNYALDGVVVAAWIYGGEAGSGCWYPLEVITTEDQKPGDGKTWRTPIVEGDDVWKHPIWMRVEIPEGAKGVIFARGKYLDGTDSWSGLKGKHEGNPFNKTEEYSFSNNIGSNNVYTPTNWNAKHWYNCDEEGCEFGSKVHMITSGEWSHKTVEELAEELEMPNLAEGYSYAKIIMEPTEDDTSLASISINGSEVPVSHRIVYTLPFVVEDESDVVLVEADSNYREASVEITPSEYNIPNGEFKEFLIKVTSKNERYTEEYVVKVKRAFAPVDPKNTRPSDEGICYILDDEEKIVTFVFEYDKWGYEWNKEKIIEGTETHKVILRGSFTRIFNESRGAWVEDVANYTMSYDKEHNWYFISVPYEKLRPGYSGQVEYKFVVDLYEKGWADADFIDLKCKFYADKKKRNMMMFFGDETEERLNEIEENKILANEEKDIADFDVSVEEDRTNITNFRLVPGTTKLYRSYHPYYPSHESVSTEIVRIEEIKKLMEEVGIKSDINLCKDRTDKAGRTYNIKGCDSPYRAEISDYYKEIQENNSVLYVGNETAVVKGNGVIPEGEHVYYNSRSQYMLDWVKQIVDFINMDNNQAPFLIHCEIGVDRTGVFSAIFAGLCGASWGEIAADYKSSNKMQILEFRDVNVLEYSFEQMLGVEDITQETDIKSLLVDYFTSKGNMSELDLQSAIEKITAAE